MRARAPSSERPSGTSARQSRGLPRRRSPPTRTDSPYDRCQALPVTSQASSPTPPSLGRPIPTPSFEWVARAAPGCGLAWDVGKRSGQAAVALADRFERVVATDVSAEQLAHARPCHVPHGPGRAGWAGRHVCRRRHGRPGAPRVRHGGVLRRSAPRPPARWPRRGVNVQIHQAGHGGRRRARPGGTPRPSGRTGRPNGPTSRAATGRFRSPSSGSRRPRSPLRRPLPLDVLAGYLRPWSAAERYREATGVDPVDALVLAFTWVWDGAGRAEPVWWALSVLAGRAA